MVPWNTKLSCKQQMLAYCPFSHINLLQEVSSSLYYHGPQSSGWQPKYLFILMSSIISEVRYTGFAHIFLKFVIQLFYEKKKCVSHFAHKTVILGLYVNSTIPYWKWRWPELLLRKKITALCLVDVHGRSHNMSIRH